MATSGKLNPVVARLLDIQRERNLGNSDLAAALGLNRSQWWRVKTGASEPGRRFLEAACAAFPEVSEVYLESLRDARVVHSHTTSGAVRPEAVA